MYSSYTKQSPKLTLCCYVNATNKIQIARISNVAHWYFEKVVFPGQRLIFEAPLLGRLEIHSNDPIGAIKSETIPCSELQLTTTFPVYSYQ